MGQNQAANTPIRKIPVKKRTKARNTPGGEALAAKYKETETNIPRPNLKRQANGTKKPTTPATAAKLEGKTTTSKKGRMQ